MSATAFQRMRRERIAKMRAEAEKDVNFSEMTKVELMVLLDEKGIEYDQKAKKADLLALLEPDEEKVDNTADDSEEGLENDNGGAE